MISLRFDAATSALGLCRYLRPEVGFKGLGAGDLRECDNHPANGILDGSIRQNPGREPSFALLGRHFLLAEHQSSKNFGGVSLQIRIVEIADDVRDRPS